MCYDVIGLCLKYIRDHSRFNNEHNGEGLHDHLLRRKRFFILTSDNFCISTLTNLKLEMTIFVIMMAKWMDQFVVRSNGSKSFVELEVPTVLPQTLCALYLSDLCKTNLISMYDVHGKGMSA